MNTFLSFVGAGILGLPFAFSRTGMFAAGFVLVMVAVLSCRCTLQLIHCKHSPLLRGATIESYGDLGFHAYGRFGAIAVDVALVISQCAFCCAYLIFIGTNLHSVFPSVSDYAAVLLLCPFLAGLATIRYLKQLAPFSLIADVANIGGILLVLYQYSWEPGYWEAAVGGGTGAGAAGGAAAGGAGAGDAVTAAAAAAAAAAANALALVNDTAAQWCQIPYQAGKAGRPPAPRAPPVRRLLAPLPPPVGGGARRRRARTASTRRRRRGRATRSS